MDSTPFSAQNSMLWQPPSRLNWPGLPLDPIEIHLWRVDLAALTPQIPQLEPLLSADEQHRAARYVFAHHRHRYIVARGLLRLILSRYTGVAAADLEFNYAANGKPSLVQPLSLQFNLSHSQDRAMYTVGADRSLGIDLEFLRPVDHLIPISRRYFSEAEVRWLEAETNNAQALMFFRLWTAKEAYLKATGVGISQLQHICLAQSPTGHLQLCPQQNGIQNTHPWQLLEFCPYPEYRAALAYTGIPAQITCWDIAADADLAALLGG
jgi:4'-phosphopantetheinyl transferase